MRRIREPSYWWILSLMFLTLPKHKDCQPGKYSQTHALAIIFIQPNSSGASRYSVSLAPPFLFFTPSPYIFKGKRIKVLLVEMKGNV